MGLRPSHMTPLSMGGTRTVHAGKGSTQAPLPAAAAGGPPAFSPGYAKPTTPPQAPGGPGAPTVQGMMGGYGG